MSFLFRRFNIRYCGSLSPCFTCHVQTDPTPMREHHQQVICTESCAGLTVVTSGRQAKVGDLMIHRFISKSSFTGCILCIFSYLINISIFEAMDPTARFFACLLTYFWHLTHVLDFCLQICCI